jgi:hypothetical protein
LPDTKWNRRWVSEVIDREQTPILLTLDDNEEIRFLGRSEHSSGGVDSDAALLVTNRRLLVIRKGKVKTDIELGRITRAGMPYDTSLHKHRCAFIAERPQQGLTVHIESPDEARKFLQSLGFRV